MSVQSRVLGSTEKHVFTMHKQHVQRNKWTRFLHKMSVEFRLCSWKHHQHHVSVHGRVHGGKWKYVFTVQCKSVQSGTGACIMFGLSVKHRLCSWQHDRHRVCMQGRVERSQWWPVCAVLRRHVQVRWCCIIINIVRRVSEEKSPFHCFRR